jgi:hypothetical protein
LTEIIVRKDDEIPVVKMITPGRRAYDLMNKWFHDWMGEKIAHLQGRSSFGPGGSVQRQRINRSSNYDHRRFDN